MEQKGGGTRNRAGEDGTWVEEEERNRKEGRGREEWRKKEKERRGKIKRDIETKCDQGIWRG